MTEHESLAADDLTRRGVAAAQDGETAEAHRLLSQAVQANPRDARAWLWLFAVAGTDEDRRACLERVLEIEPENAGARRELERLDAPREAADLPLLEEALAGAHLAASPTPPAPAGRSRRIGGWGIAIPVVIGAGLVVAALAVVACAFVVRAGSRIGIMPPDIVDSRNYPTPTPIVPQVALLSVRGHSSASDGCVVEGEITNLTESPLELYVVAYFCAAKEDTRAFDNQARLDRVPLPPGQASRFRVGIPYDPQMRYAQVRFRMAAGQGLYTRDDTQEGGSVDWWVPQAYIELE